MQLPSFPSNKLLTFFTQNKIPTVCFCNIYRMIAVPHQSSNVIITTSAAHKVWSITSRLLSGRGALLTLKPPSVCVGVSCSQREKGQEDICFMSAGSVALGFGVIGLPLSASGQNMDLSFLKETLRTSVPTAWGGATEREERKDRRDVEGRGRAEGWTGERLQEVTMCVKRKAPGKDPHTLGEDWGLQDFSLSAQSCHCPWWPCQPSHSQVCRQYLLTVSE